MARDQFARAWGEIRARVKGKGRWNRLTDRDLHVGGNAETLIGMIQGKCDEPRKAIEMQLARLIEETREATG